MVTRNTNRRAGDAVHRRVVRDWRDGRTQSSQTALTPQTAIRAELIGDDACTALGLTARGAAPVLALCRSLIEAGHDSTTPLETWRGKTFCLRVSSIGQGARLTVRAAGSGCPAFARECTDGAGASLARKTGRGPYQPAARQQRATVAR
jgi:hypothetical protein